LHCQVNLPEFYSDVRVTSHCSAYNFDELLKFLKARKSTYETDARTLDDVIYTPYTYKHAPVKARRPGSISRGSRSRPSSPAMGDLLGLGEDVTRSDDDIRSRMDRRGKGRLRDLLEEVPDVAEVFIFKYGTVVIWGMSEEEEQRFLVSM